MILNTWFQHQPRHLYTWKSLGGGTRNQIIYSSMSVTQVKSYPGTDSGSYHYPMVATVRVKLRKLMTQQSQTKLKIDLLRREN